MTLWRQTAEIARIDLVVERRLGDTFRIVLPFAVVAMMIFSIVAADSGTSLNDLGTAIFWAVAILYGMQVALRTSVSETSQRRDTTMLLGVDPAARFLGRSLAATLLLLGFMAVLWTSMLFLFSPDLPDGWLLPVLFASTLASVGLAMLSTLAGEVASGLRNRSSLASLIVAPLLIPVVVGASQVLESMERGNGILLWILLLTTADLALFVAGIALSRPLEEATR